MSDSSLVVLYIGALAVFIAAASPITYCASEPWGARVVPGEAGPLISLDGHQHITIQGLVLDGRMQRN